MQLAGKVTIMFFIKAAFWLGLVVAFIPVRQTDLGDNQRSVSAFETIGLAQSVIKDVGSFCKRNEQTCATGSTLISQMGLKAREGARIAFNWLDKEYGPENTIANADGAPSLDPVTTSSINVENN